MKRIIAKIAGLVYENTKFFQKNSPLKKRRGTSSPVDGPGSFDQSDNNIHNFQQKVNKWCTKSHYFALLCLLKIPYTPSISSICLPSSLACCESSL